MNKPFEKTIGIIGGAGPMASCLLNQYIVQICQNEWGCKEDRDFPSIISYSFPFSPMLSTSDAAQNDAAVTEELSFSLKEVSRGRRLVHRNCLQYAAHISS